MLRKRYYQAGDTVKVRSITVPCYALPDGLPDGATVKVLKKDIGYDDVEFEGKAFRVSIILIDSGYHILPDNVPSHGKRWPIRYSQNWRDRRG